MTLRRLSADASEALRQIHDPKQSEHSGSEDDGRDAVSRGRLLELLGAHDPLCVGTIEADLRSIVEEVVWTYDPGVLFQLRWSTHDRYSSQKLAAKAALLSASDSGAALALTAHGSGFVRETALKHIQSIESAFALALVLRRLNDWVPEVRRAASDAIDRCLLRGAISLEQTSQIVAGCLKALLGARELGRMRAPEFDVVDRLLQQNGVLDELLAQIRSSSQDLAGNLLKLALKRGLLAAQLPDLARHARHHSVRRLALGTILKGEFVWKEYCEVLRTGYTLAVDKDALAQAGLADRSVDVQRVALQYVLDTPGSPLNTEDVFRPFLESRRISLADNAAFGLKRLAGGEGFSADLLRVLKTEHQPPFWAARLLARYGTAAQRAEIRVAYDRTTGKPDLQWLDLLARMEDRSALDELLQIALGHEDEALARRASSVLEGKRFICDFSMLAPVIRRRGNEFEKRRLRRLLSNCGTIDIVRTALLLSTCEPEQDLESLWRLVGKKRQTRAFFPKRTELETLKEDLAGATPEVRRRVEGLIGLSGLQTS